MHIRLRDFFLGGQGANISPMDPRYVERGKELGYGLRWYCSITVVILYIASYCIKCLMLNICESFSNSFESSTITIRNCLIIIIYILCIMAVVLLLMLGSQCDAPTAYDAALIAMVPCWELRMSFRNYNLWRLTHVGHVDTKSQNAQHRFTAPTSQKFRCTPVLHDIKMPLANASAVWQNVGHKLHWQEPVWKVVFHRQSFFRTLFFISLPNHPLCTMWTRAELPAAVQKICFTMESWRRQTWQPSVHDPIVLVAEANGKKTHDIYDMAKGKRHKRRA